MSNYDPEAGPAAILVTLFFAALTFALLSHAGVFQ